MSPANQNTFSRTAGQSQAYYDMLEFGVGDKGRQPSANFNMQSSSVYGRQCIHNEEQYSKRARTNEQYTIYLVRVEECHPNVRLTKPLM